MLMQLGALATIGVQQPRNLSIVVLDNECYGETGRQRTHTASGVDLAGVARACGIENASVARTRKTSPIFDTRCMRNGSLFSQVKIAASKPPLVMPPRDGSISRTASGPRYWMKSRSTSFRHMTDGAASGS